VEFTGERVIPGGTRPDLLAEHVRRYVFAGDTIPPGSRVLDAGCGTGYGTAYLAGTNARVVGVDIAADAIGFAREHFLAENTIFQQMDCSVLDFPAAHFDAAVSFELVEHLHEDAQARFVAAVRRVLIPGGVFIVSTPNRTLYDTVRMHGQPNPFHQHEMSIPEFRALLEEQFMSVDLYGERKTRQYEILEMLRADQERKRRLLWYLTNPVSLAVKVGEKVGVGRRPAWMTASAPPAAVPGDVRIDDFEVVSSDIDTAVIVIAVCRSPR